MGGIQCWQDAVEFLLAGATGLAVGTALFLDPNIPVQILGGLRLPRAEGKQEHYKDYRDAQTAAAAGVRGWRGEERRRGDRV